MGGARGGDGPSRGRGRQRRCAEGAVTVSRDPRAFETVSSVRTAAIAWRGWLGKTKKERLPRSSFLALRVPPGACPWGGSGWAARPARPRLSPKLTAAPRCRFACGRTAIGSSPGRWRTRCPRQRPTAERPPAGVAPRGWGRLGGVTVQCRFEGLPTGVAASGAVLSVRWASSQCLSRPTHLAPTTSASRFQPLVPVDGQPLGRPPRWAAAVPPPIAATAAAAAIPGAVGGNELPQPRAAADAASPLPLLPPSLPSPSPPPSSSSSTGAFFAAPPALRPRRRTPRTSPCGAR